MISDEGLGASDACSVIDVDPYGIVFERGDSLAAGDQRGHEFGNARRRDPAVMAAIARGPKAS